MQVSFLDMPIPTIPLPSGSVTTHQSQTDPKPSSKDFMYDQLKILFFFGNLYWPFLHPVTNANMFPLVRRDGIAEGVCLMGSIKSKGKKNIGNIIERRCPCCCMCSKSDTHPQRCAVLLKWGRLHCITSARLLTMHSGIKCKLV
jgi:hypothetical protein